MLKRLNVLIALGSVVVLFVWSIFSGFPTKKLPIAVEQTKPTLTLNVTPKDTSIVICNQTDTMKGLWMLVDEIFLLNEDFLLDTPKLQKCWFYQYGDSEQITGVFYCFNGVLCESVGKMGVNGDIVGLNLIPLSTFFTRNAVKVMNSGLRWKKIPLKWKWQIQGKENHEWEFPLPEEE